MIIITKEETIMNSNFIENLKKILDFEAMWDNHPDFIIAIALLCIMLVVLDLRQLSEDRKKTNARCRAIRYRHLKR